ncbi:DUF1772-domain-containing protein [Didymella exigua CBS 183.55]|uniref:DUF1772-domain-containing protein n=1 Tax=Didymella exigua CBS 183.55 TaxID=1150837 RepID=A0A6A5RXV6_9PLEO|nr:DUF1772-domain-containing protein [Didymella exigua CBS 183.55]KAF1932180.1 DUF1772-domain-containing protein [Didymella exigua CBS 183.55]
MPDSLIIAKAVGIVVPAWLAGNIGAYSLVSAPAILTAVHKNNVSISHALQVWAHLYDAGHAQNPPIAFAAAASLGFCAWTTGDRRFWWSSAATIGIVPFTLLFMQKTLDRIFELARKADKEALATKEAEEAEKLLHRWVWHNGVRSLFPLVGSIITATAIFNYF